MRMPTNNKNIQQQQKGSKAPVKADTQAHWLAPMAKKLNSLNRTNRFLVVASLLVFVAAGVFGLYQSVNNNKEIGKANGSDSYTITEANVGTGTCSPSSIPIGSTITCTFPLIGIPIGSTPRLPTKDAVSASISSAIGVGGLCLEISGSNLVCKDIPSTGGNPGNQNVTVSFFGVAPGSSRAQVTLVSNGGPQASVDKKILVNGQEVDNPTIQPGQTITERIYYNNTGDQSFDNVSIQSSIPQGFTVTGLKNCMVPSPSEEICSGPLPINSLITNNQLSVSPVAGLYDAGSPASQGGTSPNSTSGILPIGQKKYVQLTECVYLHHSGGPVFQGRSYYYSPYTAVTLHFVHPRPVDGTREHYGAVQTASNTVDNEVRCAPGYNRSYILFRPNLNPASPFANLKTNIDIAGKRYFRLTECTYANSYNTSQVYSPYVALGVRNFVYNGQTYTFGAPQTAGNTLKQALDCGQGGPDYVLQTPNSQLEPNNSRISNIDILGKRYLQLTECIYIPSNLGNVYPYTTFAFRVADYTNLDGTPVYWGAPQVASNTIDQNANCAPGGKYPYYTLQSAYNNNAFSHDAKSNIDLLDTTRGKGYIELTMTAPTTLGTYTQNVTLSGINGATDTATFTVGNGATAISPTNLGNSVDCTPNRVVAIGQTYTCNFPLTGDANNNYQLPNGGITAGTSSVTGQSPACAIVNNGTPQATLQCTNIPTTNGTPGQQNVLLTIGSGTTPVDKGDVTLARPLTQNDIASGIPNPTGNGTTPFGDLLNCPASANLNTNVTCTGTLPSHILPPTDGLKLNVQGQTPVACTFQGQNFTCSNLPVGGSAGVLPIQVATGNNTPTNTGRTINVTDSNSTGQTGSGILLIDQSKLFFNPSKDQAKVYGTANLEVGVLGDTRIQNGATCQFRVRPYPTANNANPAFSTTGLSNGGTATYQNGKCSVVFDKAAQTQWRWEFEIRVTNPNGGQVYGADPSYYLLMGGVPATNITVLPV
jgi:uncharacterized repeat protein (TIGR01451 family)